MTHPDALRRAALDSSSGAPWVTWYRLAPAADGDCEVAARVELSNATLANWVAKAAGFLSEEFDVGPGTTVGLALPLHWLTHVWAYGAWALGAAVAVVPIAGPAVPPGDELAVTITGVPTPEGASPAAATPTAGPVAACSLDPMGLPLGRATPAGAVDALAEVRGYPDVFAFDPVPASATVLVTPIAALHPAAAAPLAAGRSPDVVTDAPDSPERLLRALLTGPLHGRPTVLADVSGCSGCDPAAVQRALATIARQEGLAPPGKGASAP